MNIDPLGFRYQDALTPKSSKFFRLVVTGSLILFPFLIALALQLAKDMGDVLAASRERNSRTYSRY